MTPTVVAGSIVSLGLLLLLVAVGMRVYAAMVTAGIVAALIFLDTLQMTAFIPFTSAASWSLAAIPLFVFMGAICLHAGISDGLYQGASVLLGRLPGGLLHSNILACALFSAISGSTTATAVTVGSVAIPELRARGYSERITTGSLAAGSILGSLIPPSTVFIIYGSMTDTSIGKLFFAGLFPGVGLAILYMVVIFLWVSMRPQLAPRGDVLSLKAMIKGIQQLIPIMIISLVVLGGIYLGVFTPVEGGAVGCFTAVVVALVRGRLTWRALHEAAKATIKTTTFLVLIIVGSSVLANTLAGLRIPYSIAKWTIGLAVSPTVILVSFCVMYLVLGCVMESIPILIMTLPVIFPVAMELGFDPIWFGVIVTLLTQIAMITPPVGLSLYAIQGLRGDTGTLKDVFQGIAPFIVAALAMVVVVIAYPPLSTWLPRFMMD